MDKQLSTPPAESWKDLFFREAFFLYEHKEAILADSRMAFTPLPFGNNLAYTGTSGLKGATLGVYLEWWDRCERSVIREDGEVVALTYFLAGSPLTGSNSCSAVTRSGKTMGIRFQNPFYELWSPFMAINQLYAEARPEVEPYSLEETVARLKAGPDGIVDEG